MLYNITTLKYILLTLKATIIILLCICLNSCENSAETKFYRAEDIEHIYNITNYVNTRKTDSINFKGKLNGYKYVDLGLSVKWATHNIGTTSPIAIGEYFAWGEITPKNSYTEKNYKWNSFRVELEKKRKSDINIICGTPEFDAATASWGDQWRMPTRKEWEELLTFCEWNVDNISNCYQITSRKNNNSITLPFGHYWTSTFYGTFLFFVPYEPETDGAYSVIIERYIRGVSGAEIDDIYPNKTMLHLGLCIRPVADI